MGLINLKSVSNRLQKLAWLKQVWLPFVFSLHSPFFASTLFPVSPPHFGPHFFPDLQHLVCLLLLSQPQLSSGPPRHLILPPICWPQIFPGPPTILLASTPSWSSNPFSAIHLFFVSLLLFWFYVCFQPSVCLWSLTVFQSPPLFDLILFQPPTPLGPYSCVKWCKMSISDTKASIWHMDWSVNYQGEFIPQPDSLNGCEPCPEFLSL